MKYFIYLLLVSIFSFNAFSQKKIKGWNEFKVGMPLAEGKKLLEERCEDISEDIVLTGYNCGTFFNRQLDIYLHEKYKYLFFSPYVRFISLSIETTDISKAQVVFTHLMKNYKNTENYKKYKCDNIDYSCFWFFENSDVELRLMRGILDKSVYDITITFRDILNY